MTAFKIEHNVCSYHMAAVAPDAVALFGCDKLAGPDHGRQKLFSRDDWRTVSFLGSANGDYLATQCNRYRVGRSTPSGRSYVQTVPDRIEVMRLYKLEKYSRSH